LSIDWDRPPVWCDRARSQARRERIREAVRGQRIGVLMGGDSGEREVSLRSGAGVAGALSSVIEAEVTTVDVHYESLDEAGLAQRFDLLYIVLHGGRGEDGTIQGYLDCLGLPYTGPGVLGCSLSMDKITSSRLLEHAGVAVPAFHWAESGNHTEAVVEAAIESLGLPLVTKPRAEGSSLGVRFCHTEEELLEGVRELQRDYGGGMVCELVPDPEITIGIVQGWPMGVLELRPQREFYDYTAKYTKGLTEFIIPARLEPEVTARALKAAVRTAEVLECREMCRVDMRIARDGTPKVLDVNASPGMTETSDLPQGAGYLGMSYAELTLEVLGTALVRAGKLSAEEWR
jgi:D-alanine-D-alanine ligase